ncbi:hypothetical protein ACOMHN_049357 [Nucella lapillus]
MEVNKERVTILTVTIVTGGLANLFLLLSLRLTWKYWRQAKWYVIMLVAANWLELAFRFGTYLAWHYTLSWHGAEWSCKLLMTLRLLGSNLGSMAVGALGVHTFLTTLTGSQGQRLRHSFVLGFFLVLALALPMVEIARYRLLPIPFLEDGSQQCVTFHFFPSVEREYGYIVGRAIALVYLPLLIASVCAVVSYLLLKGRKGNIRGDEHVSDLIITYIWGAVLFICCFPFHTHFLITQRKGRVSPDEEKVSGKLHHLEHYRNAFTALLTAAFAYLYVYRKGHKTHLAPPTTDDTTGEQQKLVN